VVNQFNSACDASIAAYRWISLVRQSQKYIITSLDLWRTYYRSCFNQLSPERNI
jgi:hypothetical protein